MGATFTQFYSIFDWQKDLYSDVIAHVNLLAPCGQWLTLRNDMTHPVLTEANVLMAAAFTCTDHSQQVSQPQQGSFLFSDKEEQLACFL